MDYLRVMADCEFPLHKTLVFPVRNLKVALIFATLCATWVSQGVMPLSAADIFDRNTVDDLLNLDAIIYNLASLTVKNGQLSVS